MSDEELALMQKKISDDLRKSLSEYCGKPYDKKEIFNTVKERLVSIDLGEVNYVTITGRFNIKGEDK